MSDRRRSPSPSGRGSQSPSRASAAGPSSGWTQGPGFDPARGAKQDKGNTRMELPPDAYTSETQKDKFALRGKNLNTEGMPVDVELNQLRMTKFDFNKRIYQYDVVLSPEPDKLGPVMKKIWAHPKLRAQLQPYKGDKWLFDGKKLAWAPALLDRGEIRCKIDLDEGKLPPGGKARPGAEFYVTIRKTTEIKVGVLQSYLENNTSFNNSVQEALNFLDHLVRQWPSQKLLAIKRNFYQVSNKGSALGDGTVVQVRKGMYASVRMSQNMNVGGVGLGYNIDVANTCFWTGEQALEVLVCNFLATCDRDFQGTTPLKAIKLFKPVKRNGRLESSDAFKQLRKLRRLKFKVNRGDRTGPAPKVYTIVDFVFNEKYGEDGANARNVSFEHNGAQISVAEYFRQKYNVNLRYADLPLIDAGKGGKIPMELAWVESMQRYPFKLNPDQTAAMIKIAVTRPPVRKRDIKANISELKLDEDPFLREYGVNFETEFAKTKAKILPPPKVKFQGNAFIEPRYSGRWDLRGKKFWKPNNVPLQSWGFVVIEQDVPLPVLQQFAATFKTTYMGHGGKVTKDPRILRPSGQSRMNVADVISWAHEDITKATGYTQLLFCVVSKKNSGSYERLKKSADCRFGILTQVVVANHVLKNNGQYHSNVAMKVNAKLGGATSFVSPPWKCQNFFPRDRPTMMIGVDVSHGAPGANTPSTAAMTMSIDPDATRYAALVETNGYRVEMLTPANVRMMFGQLSNYWRSNHGGGVPAHIIYFRDGVSEGQFAQVLDQEIGEIKAFLKGKVAKMPKFTVIVATKRHHIRMFPLKGDKNGNPLPGTLVEQEVTHPFMWDFYLNSHVAIQGTARPVHYHVILDEMKVPVNDLQKMIYQQCYSYARSTTPVSLHPAVYYAHLASNRARAHENIATSEGFRSGPKGHEMTREKIARGISLNGPERGIDSVPLLRLGGNLQPGRPPLAGEEAARNFFRQTMWYI